MTLIAYLIAVAVGSGIMFALVGLLDDYFFPLLRKAPYLARLLFVFSLPVFLVWLVGLKVARFGGHNAEPTWAEAVVELWTYLKDGTH